MTTKSHTLLGFLALVGATALSTGCAASVQAGGGAVAPEPIALQGSATLVAIGNGVWVVRDTDRATYYVDDAYWAYDHGTWSRSHTYDGGWAVVGVSAVPHVIVSCDHAAYVHYKGSADSPTRPAPHGEAVAMNDRHEPPAVGNPHGGPPGHDDVPGHGKPPKADKAEGEPPGHAAHAEPAKTAASPGNADAKPEPASEKKHGTPPGVGNARKSAGEQPGQVGNGGAAASPAPNKNGKK